ncbi:MAG: tetratricopeptide repeat protein [Gammaproteobacteria bacterium]
MSDSDNTAPNLKMVLTEAHALVERRRYAHARTTISHGLQHFPDNSELLYLAAFIDYAQDDHESAMQTVQRVLATDPEHYGARRLAAHLHEERKQYPQAEELWIGLLREYPEDADCYGSYAELMLKTLNLDKASRLAQEGLRHHPDHPGCLYVVAMSDVITGRAKRGQQSEALLRLLRAHPEQVRTSTALVIALSDQGRQREALRISQELLRSQPDSAHFVALVRELKMQSHWTMLPLYPMQRWGWGGAAAVSVAGIIGVRALDHAIPEPYASVVVYTWLVYVIYSWVWPSILRRLI